MYTLKTVNAYFEFHNSFYKFFDGTKAFITWQKPPEYCDLCVDLHEARRLRVIGKKTISTNLSNINLINRRFPVFNNLFRVFIKTLK